MGLEQPDNRERLSRIATLWTVMRQAHPPPGDDAGAVEKARRVLMERYCTAAHRYLLGALRDEEAADELFQEFALRFLRGDFRSVGAGRGRFRDYLRTVLIHLVTDHHRRRQRGPRPLDEDVASPPAYSPMTSKADDDARFVEDWRTELIDHAWAALEKTNPQSQAVLLFHVNNEAATASEAAAVLSKQLGKTMTPENIRVSLHRARERFAQALLAEVELSLEQPTFDELVEELTSLGLRSVCATALQRWAKLHGAAANK